MLCNVLIIDSRKELSTKYKKSITDNDTSVYVANNIKSALTYIQTNEPDLIIISDSIPEEISVFCEKIRVLTYNIRPIIVAISKSDELDDKIKALKSGADDYISEPVNIKEFQVRIKAHLRRELESNLDNKTLLPNKKYAQKVLKRVLSDDKTWAAFLVSIENFKQYIDVYTEFAGDKVIQTLIAIIKSTFSEDDFISRLSDTELLIITRTLAIEKLASYITFAFDSVAPRFYSEEDIKRGYMLLQGDDKAGMRIEFVSLLVSAVSNEFSQYTNSDYLLNNLRRIKNLAKAHAKSGYIVDRPKLQGKIADSNSVNKKIVIKEKDSALELLLRTTLELQGYDVLTEFDENTVPAIFLIDSDNKKNLKLCSELKNNNLFAASKIIVTSTEHAKEMILDSGADLYLPKPYEMQTLIKWIEYFMKELEN